LIDLDKQQERFTRRCHPLHYSSNTKLSASAPNIDPTPAVEYHINPWLHQSSDEEARRYGRRSREEDDYHVEEVKKRSRTRVAPRPLMAT
jgi:hypothetical protein